MAEIIIAGISNCDSVKKTKKYFRDHEQEFGFLDLKNPAFDPQLWQHWLDCFGAKLINKQSRSWRQLSVEQQSKKPLELLAQFPTLAKRPIVSINGQWISIGYVPEQWIDFIGN